MLINLDAGFLGGGEKVLNLHYGDGYITLKYEKTLNHVLSMGKFMVSKLYLNKAILKMKTRIPGK